MDVFGQRQAEHVETYHAQVPVHLGLIENFEKALTAALFLILSCFNSFK